MLCLYVRQVRAPRTGAGAEGRGTRRVRAPHSTRERQKAAAVTRGEHIMAPSQLKHYETEAHNKSDPVYICKSPYLFLIYFGNIQSSSSYPFPH
jgi:hypothetical protein